MATAGAITLIFVLVLAWRASMPAALRAAALALLAAIALHLGSSTLDSVEASVTTWQQQQVTRGSCHHRQLAAIDSADPARMQRVARDCEAVGS